ncbi:conserved hypothetical protein [Dethiobacter alkaliphilus AHT 1]|uniref:UPF0316 protein DealDRAFT_2935 n=2 Tax=Dethiobacter TaxID=427925 RepID=C0GKC6_DETAL|nr:conserved hypothetical protein [Dethiobacter alkaliphilus AHT 1]
MPMVLIILVINIVYISLLTVRTMFLLKGKRYHASLISAAEAFVFVLGIGLVIENLGEIQNLIAYAAGFAIGILVGTRIEEYLALGYVTVKVISKHTDYPFAQMLRDKGFGITSWLGEGRDGKRLVMEILTSRKNQRDLYNHIVAYDPEAFVISHEPQHFRGGFWVKKLRNYYQLQGEEQLPPAEEILPGMDPQAVEEIQQAEDINLDKYE